LDDTLFHHSGKKVNGAGYWRDAVRSTKSKTICAWKTRDGKLGPKQAYSEALWPEFLAGPAWTNRKCRNLMVA
jgi:hypothetical protein